MQGQHSTIGYKPLVWEVSELLLSWTNLEIKQDKVTYVCKGKLLIFVMWNTKVKSQQPFTNWYFSSECFLSSQKARKHQKGPKTSRSSASLTKTSNRDNPRRAGWLNTEMINDQASLQLCNQRVQRSWSQTPPGGAQHKDMRQWTVQLRKTS